MHFTRVFLGGLCVAALVGCESDPVSTEVVPEPFSSIRWVNGVADTVAMDYRIVDVPTNASEPNLPFRASSGNWRNLPPGSHRIRVFFTNTTAAGTDVSVVSQVIVDTTLTFDQGKKYTIVHYGFTKAGATPADRLILIEDVPPTPAAGQIGLRAINAAPALGSVDVFAEPATVSSTAPATTPPIFSNLAPAAVANWIGLAALPGPVPPSTTPPATSYRVAAAPTATNVPTAAVLAPPGQPAVPSTTVAGVVSQPFDAIAGTQQPSSDLTAVIFGPQVSYTLRTPTGGSVVVAAGTVGGVGVLLDKHPPRISP